MKKASEAALSALLATSLLSSAAVPVAFELPAGGHYLVTLAAAKADDPGKPLATFVCGRAFDTTVSNRFVVEWNGLDDNFMPLPPGDYAIRGIVSPAHRWAVDGEYHAISARWVGGAGEWWPSPAAENVHEVPIPFYGDPVNSPLLDIDITPEGIAVLGYQYLENGRSCPMLDLARPKGHGQFLAAFPSGGAGGGPCACTDGETVWACSFDSAPYFVYRPDMRPFGTGNAMYRKGGYLPEGIVTDMAAAKIGAASFVYVVERGTIEAYTPSWGGTAWRESATLRTDVITVMRGDDGAILAKVPVPYPDAAKVVGGDLLVLYRPGGTSRAIGRMPLADGIPGAVEKLFDVPAGWDAEDFACDGEGHFFFADGARNRLCKTDATGAILATAGRLPRQASGAYDPESLMNPRRLDCWRDTSGAMRLAVVEQDGPNRISEWSCADLSYIGEYRNYQLKANCGYAADPADPAMIYIPGHNGWLVRFRFDYATGEWTTDAVFDNVPDDTETGLAKAKAFRVGGRLYLVGTRSGAVFRLSDDGSEVVRAGTVREAPEPPPGAISYHGQNFLDDLTYIAVAQSTDSVWACRPSLDAAGNVSYGQWERLFADPFYLAVADGSATAFTGGNELETLFRSDWIQADGDIGGDIYVQARGGENYSANFGSQHKITRYAANPGGGYDLVWRVGRTAIAGSPKERGLIYGGMRIFKPINGILSVIDQSRSGVHLYTEDGLFIDTLFTGDAYTGFTGVYEQPGEFFVGTIYANRDNGKIYYASGKYTPMIYEMEGWDLASNPVRPLQVARECRTVTLTAARTATPPAEALRLRKAAGATGIAVFRPEAVGWEGAEPVEFSDGGDTVQVRGLYSATDLTLLWKVRKASPFVPKTLSAPERLFTHDQGADTVGFYFQGDPEAQGATPAEGRPGDVRFTFGLFRDGDGLRAVGVGFYPEWNRPGAQPQTYHTVAGGTAAFAHVGEIAGAAISGEADADGLGFTIQAKIPLSGIPLSGTLRGGFSTRVNFDANLGGHHRFWWANTDGSASRETYDEPTESRLFPGSWALCAFEGLDDGLLLRSWATVGPFGGTGARGFSADPSAAMKQDVIDYFEQAVFTPDSNSTYAPSDATYTGEQTTGWWSDAPATLSWRKSVTAPTDVRVVLGLGAQVYYAATAVWAPAETAVTGEFYSSFMSHSRWRLNGEDLGIARGDWATESEAAGRSVATKPVVLRAGWNVFWCRAYCNGYPPFKVGLRLRADGEVLASLKTSAFPGE